MQGDKFGGKNMPGRLMPLLPSRVCCWCVEVEVFFVRWGMVGGAEIGSNRRRFSPFSLS